MQVNKIGIYNPYLDILGGAERYVLTMAKCLATAEITLFNGRENLVKLAEQKFGLDIPKLDFVDWQNNWFKRRKILKQFDLLIYVTDGSLFFSSAKKNILLIQSPNHIPAKSWLNLYKLKNWQIICYSYFIQNIIEQKLGIESQVLFVPLNTAVTKSVPKKNLILSVGRFFPHLHSKKQKEMVEIFKDLLIESMEDTELYLVGSIDPGGEDYFKEVQQLAVGYPIKLLTQVTYLELVDLYSQAKIYWHAAGFGEDLQRYPEKAEHFGVSTLEAMLHRAVPLVYPGGGQTEIVQHQINGLHWQTKGELIYLTRKLLTDEKFRTQLAQNAYKTALNYSQEKFCRRFHEVIQS